MRTAPNSASRCLLAVGLSMALLGCGGSSESSTGAAGAGGTRGDPGGASGAVLLDGLGFVTSSWGFHYPSDPEASLLGFDLDGRVSLSESPAANECAHDDFTGPSGEEGLDYNFLRIINHEETREDGKYVFGGFREGQLVDGVIGAAVKNGSMTILLQVDGVDDPLNDDDVRVRVFGSQDAPALGTDNEVLAGATLSVHSDTRYHSGEARGALVDGVLTAGPLDLRFPIDIMIVSDEFLIHDAWIRVELSEGAFEGMVAGYWDVADIRSVIGKPTTDNGNAANFTIEQFDAAMAEFADAEYDESTGLCAAFSVMFQFRGLQAFIVSGAGLGGTGGAGGTAGSGGVPTLLDQCANPADEAAFEALATEELSSGQVVGMSTESCTTGACGDELGAALGDGSEPVRNALRDCIAGCMSEQTGLSVQCTSCYGSTAACSVALCLAPCAADPGSETCQRCALENCIDLSACTGLY